MVRRTYCGLDMCSLMSAICKSVFSKRKDPVTVCTTAIIEDILKQTQTLPHIERHTRRRKDSCRVAIEIPLTECFEDPINFLRLCFEVELLAKLPVSNLISISIRLDMIDGKQLA